MTPHLNGNRGQFLFSFGIIYLAIGLAYVLLEPSATVVRAMSWMPSWSSVQVCGLAWALSGLVAMVFAFTPIPIDRFGFMALSAWSAAWAIAWAIAQATGNNDRGYISALIFAVLTRAVMIVAGMRNPVTSEAAQ